MTEQELSWLLHGLHIEQIKHYEALKNADNSTVIQHKNVDNISTQNVL